MTMPLWAIEAADDFWVAAGGPGPLPRDLRIPIANALPMTVVLLPKLRVATAISWLEQHAVLCGGGVRDRPLRACLVARYGQGIIFLDGADPEDEQRFSLGHELAHFLRDYWGPRREAGAVLGPAVLEVFDGERPPNTDERIHALLARATIGFHIHLMERTADGLIQEFAVDAAERCADLLACELLAPSALVLHEAARLPSEERREAVARHLVAHFGLPIDVAGQYTATLIPEPKSAGSLIRRLGLVR